MRKHRAPGAAFESISAHKFLVLVFEIAESRQVKAAGPAVIQRRRFPNEVLHASIDARAHDVFTKIVPDVPAGIADSIRVHFGFRQQQQSRGLQRGSRHDDYFGFGGVVLLGDRIDKMHAGRFAGGRIDGNLARDRIGAQCQVAGISSGIDQASGRIEGRVNVATAFALACPASVTTAPILIVFQAIGGHACSILRQRAPHLLQAVFQGDFRTIQFGGALEDTVWQMRQILFDAGDPQI